MSRSCGAAAMNRYSVSSIGPGFPLPGRREPPLEAFLDEVYKGIDLTGGSVTVLVTVVNNTKKSKTYFVDVHCA